MTLSKFTAATKSGAVSASVPSKSKNTPWNKGFFEGEDDEDGEKEEDISASG